MWVGEPLLLDNVKLFTRGAVKPHPGLGNFTVRAQIQAMTMALEPSGRVAFG